MKRSFNFKNILQIPNEIKNQSYFDNSLTYLFGGSNVFMDSNIKSFDDDFNNLLNDCINIKNDFNIVIKKLNIK